MRFRILVVAVFLSAANLCLAQFNSGSENAPAETQLNLEQFNASDSTVVDSNKDLQLNLEQFESANDADLKLNLEQFENTRKDLQANVRPGSSDMELNLEQFGDGAAKQINTTGSKANDIGEQVVRQNPGYTRVLIVGGILVLFFLYFLSRRKRVNRF